MDIAVVGRGWWHKACVAAGHEPLELPSPAPPEANPYSADLPARLEAGRKWQSLLQDRRPEVILDNGGTGLAFVEGPGGTQDLKLFHEKIGAVLVSHFVDPLVTVCQGMPFGAVWQCLRTPTWIKCVWDHAQAIELEQMGVPNVVHLPMAALDQPYCTEPLGEPTVPGAASFVGGQNTSYFAEGNTVPTPNLLPGTLAQAVQAELGEVTFFDVFYNLYRLRTPPALCEEVSAAASKAVEYFNAKLFYNATRCIRQRDRFAIFLKRQLGDDFHLIGRRWDTAYALDCREPFASDAEYLAHFREVPININLVNGNAETALNMRHFEITAAGGFLLCYHQAEIERYFSVGHECETFRNEQELLEKIRHYLAHPEKRREIALAGQRRTLREHLYSHRLKTILETVRRATAPAPAPPPTPSDLIAAKAQPAGSKHRSLTAD